MEQTDRYEDAESPLAGITWTIEKCSDIKRALSGRVGSARRVKRLSNTELSEMARLYMAVDHVERHLRGNHGLPVAPPLPLWVRTHGTPR